MVLWNKSGGANTSYFSDESQPYFYTPLCAGREHRARGTSGKTSRESTVHLLEGSLQLGEENSARSDPQLLIYPPHGQSNFLRPFDQPVPLLQR